jgi:ATP-dependent Clp protease ATP-binding subunit ClpB
MQLEIEREALKKEKDAASKARLTNLEKAIADLKEKAGALKAQWMKEKVTEVNSNDHLQIHRSMTR